MAEFRGSDAVLDREIEALEGIVRVRLRRLSREVRDLDRDLRELKRERARRKAMISVPAAEVASGTVGAPGE